MRADTGLDLLNAVHRLPASQWDVILLYYYSDKTFEEISAIMQCPGGDSEVPSAPGPEKLRGWLGNEYRGERLREDAVRF